MRVILVYPRFKKTYWGYQDVLFYVGKQAAFPPPGVQALEAMLPNDWERKIFDLNIEELIDKDIRWADYVWISAMSTQRDSIKEVIARCKKLGRPVILGGPIVKTRGAEFPEVDCFYEGEAEAKEFVELLSDMEKRELKRFYRAEKFPDLNGSKACNWNCINIHAYSSVIIPVTKGCPYGCGFCDVADISGQVPRMRPECIVFEDLNRLFDIGFRGAILLADDNVVGDKSRSKQFLSRLAGWQKAHGYPFEFTGEFPITIADDPEIMDILVAAGFRKVFLGLETPNKASLLECNKRQNVKRNMEACVERIRFHGLIPMSGFIVGFDNDNPETFADEMVQFIQNAGIVIAMVGVLQAVPGTAIYEKLQKEGRLRDLPSGNNTDCYPNFVPRMPLEKLVQGYKNILQRIYSPKGYYITICSFLRTYDPSLRPNKRLGWTNFKAFMRANLWIGLLGGPKTSYYYWKSLLKVVFSKKRQAFADIVAFQIYGAHFRGIAKSVEKA
jgi:radical SAM superfamily enzyme YgiQ (UPF0313 family)